MVSVPEPEGSQIDSSPAYPPSWADRLMHAVDRLPGQPWMAYLVATSVLVLIAVWSDQFVDPADLRVPAAFLAIFPLFPLALIHYLDGVAARALGRYRSTLRLSDAEVGQILYYLTTMPSTPAWVATALGIALVVIGLVEAPQEILGPPGMPLAFSALGLAGTLFANLSFTLLIYHTVRQLRLVSRIHSQASMINLLQPQPLYAFSALTMRTGVALILFTYYIVAVSTGVTLGPLSVAILGVNIALSIGLFVLPLYGMHQRLPQEKERLLRAVGERIDGVLAALHKDLEAIERLETGRMDSLHKGLASLFLEKELIEKAPTWPWAPGTLRIFGVSVLIPVALLILSRLLERWMPP